MRARAVRNLLAVATLTAAALFAMAVAAGPAVAAPLHAGQSLVGDPAVQNGVGGTGAGGRTGSPADYLMIVAGVGGWMTFALWVAARHRRSAGAAFRRAVSAVADEAEEWLRDQ